MTESWDSAEEDSKSNQVHATQVSKEQPLMVVTRKGHTGVSETDQKITMNTGGMSHSKTKHRPEHQRHPAKWRRPTRSGVRLYWWSHRNPPRAPAGPTQGETPLRKSETRTNDGNRQERQGARGATMRRDLTTRATQRNGRGQAQDKARERQQSPPQKRTRPPPRRSEGWNEWATPTGPPTEEQTREEVIDPGRGRTKQRGKNFRWLAASWRVNSKRTVSPRAPGEPIGRGGSRTRRRSLQA